MKRKTRSIKGYKPSKRKKAVFNRAQIEAILNTPLFWSSPTVDAEPIIRLDTWTVYWATPHGGHSECFGLHFVGRNLWRWAGCVSSKIVSFDTKALRATTQSGRIYQLYGGPGHCLDADYVLGWWKRFNDLTVKDVTIEFLELHGLTRAELVERFARGDVRPVLVFVDVNVLHLQPPHNQDAIASRCVERFENMMRAFPICRIVISSGARQAPDLDAIRSHFNGKVAARIVGATPVVDPEAPYARQREIERYLQDTNQSGVSWLVASVQPEAFDPGLPNLVLCDKEMGFGEEAASNLARKLRELV